MRLLPLALLAPLALAGCAAEGPAPNAAVPSAVPAPVQPNSRITFPTDAEIAAGRPIRIRPAANFGEYGVIQSLPGAAACGVLQQGRVARSLPVSSPSGAVTPAFSIGGPCPRTDDNRGLPFVQISQAWYLANGYYLRGPTDECFLPHVGSNAVCVPRTTRPS
ncbi:hypothetical protein KTR66_18770 [Roseococcus sp. SDR]|uniref:hypothetical protein n=1 Tax=Roseococcus sp. SDR TaxID=2835532 RepID=UPI001BD04954|nr:hypothetical protein [Roseococcus sp. SDR]MBS7792051.1 hypothetical protein [Roseococcus sp. SDR]MBV1847365.1 hypothetical protein [Roseococcus sp. SDR]